MKSPRKLRSSAVSNSAQLRLDLVNVEGRRLDQGVDVLLTHLQLSDRRIVRGVSAGNRILIEGLHAVPQGLHRVEVDPPAYLPVSQFVNLKSGLNDLTLTFPVDARKVQGIEAPPFGKLGAELRAFLKRSKEVLFFEGKSGAQLFGTLDDARKAGLLNIAAKAQATLVGCGRTVFSYLLRLIELRGDRFFVRVPKELREEVKNSVALGLFHPVSDALHHPPEGYSSAGSFKTEDRYGNLQLTFFMNGKNCVADVDIDDAAGIEHLFQVLRNRLTGRPTNPFDIHEILVFHQKIDPGYRLLV